jgi:hypothetical protein|tara:strand:+ start:1949 stop:2308 length:360 start_codon:yes stop_codon:yes gene_type:complete
MSNNIVNLNLFRNLSTEEKIEFKKWARNNWTVGDPIVSVWHPIVIQECARILERHIRANTKKYDAGTLDWNFVYKDMTVALDNSSDVISEKEQYEMAIEYFWEQEWDKLTKKGVSNGKG